MNPKTLADCDYRADNFDLDALYQNCNAVELDQFGWLCFYQGEAFFIRQDDHQIFYLIDNKTVSFHNNKSGYYRNNLAWFTMDSTGEYITNIYLTERFTSTKKNYCKTNMVKRLSNTEFEKIRSQILCWINALPC